MIFSVECTKSRDASLYLLYICYGENSLKIQRTAKSDSKHMGNRGALKYINFFQPNVDECQDPRMSRVSSRARGIYFPTVSRARYFS